MTEIVRLCGLAMRDGGKLDDESVVPETVPVYVEYDYSDAIGTAALRRDGDEIWADAAVDDGRWRDTCRYFSLSFYCAHLADRPGGGLGVAMGVSLTARPGAPVPFEVKGSAAV